MSALSIRFDVAGAPATALIAADDSVWIAVEPRWWDLATWFWWWLCPTDRKAIVVLSRDDNVKFRTRAVRSADKHVRVRGDAKAMNPDVVLVQAAVQFRIEEDSLDGLEELVNMARAERMRAMYEAGWRPCLPVSRTEIAVTRAAVGAWVEHQLEWRLPGNQSIRIRTETEM